MTATGNESLVNVDCPDATPSGPRPPVFPAAVGDASALPVVARWLEDMRPRLLRLARRLLWNAHDAEEITQDALLCAYQQHGRVKDPGRRNAWLYRITINLAHNRLRRRRACPLPSDAVLIVGPNDHDARDGPACLPDCVRHAMSQLPERQQAALVLREMEGLSYDGIAAILEIRTAAARLLVHRARAAVRETVVRRWPEYLEASFEREQP